MNKAVIISENELVPASCLDNVLRNKNAQNVVANLYDIVNGDSLTEENKQNFYKLITEERKQKIYKTTDHLITHVFCENINWLYVSLDNSVRSNMNDEPLFKRLFALCELVNKVISKFNKDESCIVFFSESSRMSFTGGMNNKLNIHPWFEMRNSIEKYCNLKYITEKRNNEDPSGMSFGISVFCSESAMQYIDLYYGVSILSEGFGSCAIGIKTVTNKIVWGIHFPLDFKGDGVNNQGYKTMKNLQKTMIEYTGSVFAFGDFNTVRGKCENAVCDAIDTENFEFIVKDELTFFGSYYDTIKKDGEEWSLICDK